jgi:hypothetical protein
LNLSWNIDSVNDIEAGTVGVVVSAHGQSVAVKELFSLTEARSLADALYKKADELSQLTAIANAEMNPPTEPIQPTEQSTEQPTEQPTEQEV